MNTFTKELIQGHINELTLSINSTLDRIKRYQDLIDKEKEYVVILEEQIKQLLMDLNEK